MLGGCFAHLGDPVTAIAHFDRALAVKPDHEDAITRKIFALDFVPNIDFAAQQAARKYWWDQVGAKLPRRQLKARPLDPEKRIVLGYVSADFRDHSAALAFVPVLRHRDRRQFEIICYSNSPVQDSTTALCKSLADRWVDAWQLTELVASGEEEGAEIYQPPCVLPEKGYWFAPTVFTNVAQSYRIAQEEIFGPVLSVLTFRTPEEAVEKANNTPYGLSAGVWTEKGSRILWMAQRLRAGVVWANTFNRFDPSSPFGGYKESGFGREGGLHGLEPYLEFDA